MEVTEERESVGTSVLPSPVCLVVDTVGQRGSTVPPGSREVLRSPAGYGGQWLICPFVWATSILTHLWAPVSLSWHLGGTITHVTWETFADAGIALVYVWLWILDQSQAQGGLTAPFFIIPIYKSNKLRFPGLQIPAQCLPSRSGWAQLTWGHPEARRRKNPDT